MNRKKRSGLNSHRGSRGMTLVELILVICIVGILAALSLVGIQKGILMAGRAAGQANLRTLILNVHNYVNDNDGTLPGPLAVGHFSALRAASGANGQLIYFLAPYYGLERSNTGTVVKAMAPPLFLKKYDPFTYTTYFCVNNVYTTTGSILLKPWGGTTSTYSVENKTPKKMIRIPNQSRLAAIIDLDVQLGDSPLIGPASLIPTPLYGTTRNAAFWDGHIEAVPLDFDYAPHEN